jgi:hypothetical protein
MLQRRGAEEKRAQDHGVKEQRADEKMRGNVPVRSRAAAKVGIQRLGRWIVLNSHVKCGKLQSLSTQNNELDGIVGADFSFELL